METWVWANISFANGLLPDGVILLSKQLPKYLLLISRLRINQLPILDTPHDNT